MSAQSKTKDYYKILGCDRDSGDDQIKRAYRKQSLLHHPDKGGDEAKFKEIGEAYAVLSDPQKKMRYDRGDDLDGPEGIDVSQMFAQSGGFSGFGGGGFPGAGYGGGGFAGGGGGVHINVEVRRTRITRESCSDLR
jgi:DnaJ homolog subfamily C member 7